MAFTRTDALIALAGCTLAALAAAVVNAGIAQIAAAALLGGALGAARRHPRVTWLAAAALMVGTSLLGGMPGGDLFSAYVLMAAHALCAGRWDGAWSGFGGLGTLTGAAAVNLAFTPDLGPMVLLIVLGSWGAGRALREREQMAARLAEQASELESEHDAHTRLSVRYERARIASELHDIVAHAISVMVVQASAGQRLAVVDRKLTDEAFEAISGAARQAEQDMGRLLALLGDEPAVGPAPDLSLIEELIARAAGSGLAVTLRLEGERERLSAELVEAAYRVVQEGMTNALRYASGAPIAVLVRGEPALLVVEVENGAAPSEQLLAGTGTGNGLTGLRERISACGGRLEAGPRADGGWRLSARLPRGRVDPGEV